ncbi:hypothetical protein [Pseudoxanthomonas suwonensis]|uniref:hypothetical protein n=1 Tax=Pseudoxanthomonas suwonensis TaxID=314722 RepID=UPI0011866098|nr:hypothetical protein [Pseudoxanthomonas suwonensis]
MQHRVVFREITNDDFDHHCHFMPEEHEFEMHLNALAHDAEWLEGVTEVRRDGSHAIIVKTDATLGLLKERLVPLLQNHWAHLRIEL